ncbi:phosphatase domain-containing putative toxin [Diaphorobacter aerolatus]|uniref:Dual specificity protein phosphatase family protein n=1 Tax=Diaphorobacter aerolatus TaxID=1288495 RepID=A0A7H0GLZ8_9BURK|nr:protein-tyrosine phosphatase family protein [Diaphorobacter aerolatus]QNP49314.1 dual specificity protein phosphatase family protein [Diaphorobacter aerolatus]
MTSARARGPRGFTWIDDDRLAGTPYPGILADVSHDLMALRDAGITHLISLTEQPFPATVAASFGIGCSALPMADMGVPSLSAGVALCSHMDALLAAENVIAVHCRAGLGRTGTVLAMYLIWQQLGRQAAPRVIASIRSRNTGMIQSIVQERFLEDFLAHCRENALFDKPLPDSHSPIHPTN